MKKRLLYSTFLGGILPFSYFLFVDVEAVRYHQADGSIRYGSSGIIGFVEFEGLAMSLALYAIAVLICTLIAFFVITLLKAFKK